MERMKLEAYLDGELSPAEAAALEGNPAFRAELEAVRRQRAVRAAALSTYAPTSAESLAFAQSFIDAARAPVASLVWLRRSASVAAALALAAFAFYAGRATTPAQLAKVDTPPAAQAAVVVVQDRNGNVLQEKTFDTFAEAQDYAKSLAQQQPDQAVPSSESVALASPGIF